MLVIICLLLSVCGDSLKKILDNGLREKMNRAMMFLVQKSAAGAVDTRKAESSRTRPSVSIEMLDNEGKVIPESVEVGLEGNVESVVGEKENSVVLRRKRHRVDDGESRVSPVGASSHGDGVGRTITILGGNRVIMNPTRPSTEIVEVSIQPHERWGGGGPVPLRAFQLFNLP